MTLVYTLNGGTTWQAAPFTQTGEARNNDLWSMDLGAFANPTTIVYCVSATSSNAWTVWDNNGGTNYVAIVGEIGGLRMVAWTPGINVGNPGTNADNANDIFDFDTSGGYATTSGTNGFGSFGHIYVNYDATNLYIGGSGVALPDDSQNNAYIVFLSGGTNGGSGNLWDYNVSPEGLNELHNTAYQPPVNIAILLGDVWGDGTYFNFNMYKGDGFDFGQGIFQLVASLDSIAAVDGAVLSQFGGYGPDSRLAANWEAAIPLSAFGVTNVSALTNLYVSGLMVTGSTSNHNRFISGKYLGDDATLGNGEQPDAWGNFAFSFVNLAGTKIDLPEVSTDTHGVPNSWIAEQLGGGYNLTTNSNHDGDGHTDREEYFFGGNPQVADGLQIREIGPGRMRMDKTGGQICQYVLETADQVTNSHWNWSTYSTLPSTNGVVALPSFTNSNLIMRVKILVPAE